MMRIGTIVKQIVIILPAFLTCCESHTEPEQLMQAESLLEQNPDSALSLLQQVKVDCLRDEGSRAKYTLLLARARDEKGMELHIDTLIAPVADYFELEGDKRDKMLSQYYLGRSLFSADDLSGSIVAMHRALELATDLKDNFWMGKASKGISEVYNKSFNAKESLKYAEDAVAYYGQTGSKRHINKAKLELAVEYSNNMMNPKAIRLTQEMALTALAEKDTMLYARTQSLLGNLYICNSEYGKAAEVLRTLVNEGGAESHDSLSLALALIDMDDAEGASRILSGMPESNGAVRDMALYKLYKKIGRTEDALRIHEAIYNATDSLFQKRIEQSLISSTLDYYDLNRKQMERERDSYRLVMWLVLTTLLLGVIIVVILFIMYRNRQQARIEQNIIIAQQLQESLYSKENEYSNARASIKALLTSKYKMFDDLCKLVYESTNTTVARRRISDSVTALIKECQSDSSIINELEDMVNEHYSNLLVNLKNDMPSLSTLYYRLYLFSVLGFSDSAISIFLCKEKTSMIWDARRHLKDKIRQLGKDKQTYYLGYLNQSGKS